MKPVTAIVAPGNMGAALARRLTDHGLQVLTVLEGRSAATRARASAAGMVGVSRERLVDADILLSILPPAQALPFAEEMAPVLRSAERKPVFVDCNAVSPTTVERIQTVLAPTGAPFVDASIIGLPPPEGANPRVYTSGDHASRVEVLRAYGLDVRALDGPVGAASALKMCYAGINKGVAAIGAAVILAATRAGAAGALREEMSESLPELLNTLSRRIPDMLPKAYRWVAEMEEISAFTRDDPAATNIFAAFAQLFDRISRDEAGVRHEATQLTRFFLPE